jgi:ABC-2 type transport system permease protein
VSFLIVGLVLVLLALRLWRYRRRRRRTDGAPKPLWLGPYAGDVAMISAREIRERLRGRVLRVGTVIILGVIAAAIVIPVLDKSSGSTAERVGVVGQATALQKGLIKASANEVGVSYRLFPEPSVTAARARLQAGNLDLVIVEASSLVVPTTISPTDGSSSAQLVEAIAKNLGIAKALADLGITSSQASSVLSAKPLRVVALQHGPAPKSPVHSVSVFGLIIVFVMLSQYNTWILIGVMEEKSSRVVEVLLAAVRPMQLLAGKVLGIGLVAFAQATLILAFALALGKAVGSSFLQGSAPAALAATFLWLVLGYAFYCWVYAAAGSTVERQDQVQSLVFPLSLPIIFGYIMALTAVTSGSASELFKVLAYLPPTAPFAMPVLVGFGEVTWWEFAGSALISIGCTVLVAKLATSIYRRAILRTGRRVHLRELLASPSR